LDHVRGAKHDDIRDDQAEHLGGGEIDGEIELGRLFDRDVGWFRATESFDHLVGAQPNRRWHGEAERLGVPPWR
jgi:hypothetical protein